VENTRERAPGWSRTATAPVLLSLWATAIALSPTLTEKLLLAGPVVGGALLWWAILGVERWLFLFFFAALLLPPLPGPAGNSGISLAPLALVPGVAVGLLRVPEWRRWRSTLPLFLGFFLTVLLLSAGLAVLYSGGSVAAGSLARVVLFGASGYVFIYAFGGPRESQFDPFLLTRFLFAAACAGSLFACADFYFQWPAPAGFGAQFIWVGDDILRRAQGLFYEASTLGNFCAFFLVMILVGFSRPSAQNPVPRFWMVAGGCVLAAALIFSYSRASLVCVFVAAIALVLLLRLRVRRILLTAAAVAVAGWLVIRFAAPGLSSHYVERLQISFQFLFEAPDRVLSGRLATWATIAGFIREHPLDLIFGIGYKTLPYTDYVPGGIIVDNTYLSLLVETGVVGLLAFLALNVSILRTAFRAARCESARASFLGTWIFCFWCGEMVQMFSGDLITFWRVLPVYFWVLGTAAREAGD
jgi:O-antigen ligase